MTPIETAEPGLVKRLLADAEGKAAEGRIREGFVLLRWASRLAPLHVVPVVLLTYHRLRTAGQGRVPEAEERVIPERGASALGSRVPLAGGVAADALGFPVPRFPTRAPDLDRTAFVPAPRHAEEVRPAPARSLHAAPAHGRRPAVGWLAPALAVTVIAAAAGLVRCPTGTRHLPEWMQGLRGDPADAADAALRAGDPARALALTQDVADPGPRLLLIRGRAALALGDTAGGCAAVQSAAAHPLVDARGAWEAAELLAGFPGRETAAAEAYLRAFSLGLPPEKWEAVARALDRDDRKQQAARVRGLILYSAGRSGM
jgi:hypothetical protein